MIYLGVSSHVTEGVFAWVRTYVKRSFQHNFSQTFGRLKSAIAVARRTMGDRRRSNAGHSSTGEDSTSDASTSDDEVHRC